MLALTRKAGERIVIGDNIVVTVVGIKGDSIRLTIDAPKEIKIYRGEIYDAIAAENKEAAIPMDLAELTALKEFHIKK
ncbi:carbon storage regulator CsrA [Desulfitobacterium hafniense]|uniref:carbon storage regulator CsrA n=1 Tax=Desulfitobacterium hafniense TaxID=49338 RepID=UPI000363FEC5|nr:carbon storage regulator CsrA [Desulfitobacterium hafniense]